MKLPRYQLIANDDLTTFEFISIGPKGRIYKVVQFTPSNTKNLYNLAFGDLDRSTREIDDMVVSNNNDTEKVLATIVAAVFAFTAKYPNALIYAVGSTNSRTRLYRMGITKYLSEVQHYFVVYGELTHGFVLFEQGKDYRGFLVKRKTLRFVL